VLIKSRHKRPPTSFISPADAWFVIVSEGTFCCNQ
jgi:hypothetical protein